MQDILEICCGLDVHKDTVVACLLKGSITDTPSKEIRTFSTLLPNLNTLRTWLEEEQCNHIAMESTGVYWQPIYAVLEDLFNSTVTLIVTNARHMKNVPGKKTDIKDSEWIATLLRAGLLKSSFIPTEEIRELRDFTRYRKSIIADITSQKNRVEKHLQSCGFKLSSFLSDIFGVSGRAIIDHLSERGVINPSKIQEYVKGRAKAKTEDIKIAVNGKMTEHQKDFLKVLLERLDEDCKHLYTLDLKIESALENFKAPTQLIDEIPGINITAAATIIAEIGVDMSKFKTAQHISSWAGLSPGNNESAGKRKSTRITKGNTYLKTVLCEVAWSITRVKSSYLSSWFWKLKQRRGAKKAVIALARKILVIIYTMLKENTSFNEERFKILSKKQQEKRKNRLLLEAKKLGLTIIAPSKLA